MGIVSASAWECETPVPRWNPLTGMEIILEVFR
jgi:hypothetical protein